MASTMKMSLQTRAAAAPRRAAVVVRAEAADTRRAVLGGLLAFGAAALAAPEKATATKLPWQESTGGLGQGGGSMPKSGTLATSSGYVMEGYPGTRKPSYLPPKEKRALLAEAREKALAGK